MKVLHVIPSLAAVHGGPSRAIVLMEQALSALGVEVETATTDDDGPGRRNGRPDGVALRENGVVRRYFRKDFEFYKPSFSFARWMGAHARDYDLIHVHALFSFTATVAARTARRQGVPYIVRPLGTLNAYGLARHRPMLKRASMHWIEAPLLRNAAAIHFTSDEEAQEARALGIAWREAVIPLGVPLAAAHAPVDAPRVLFLSRIAPKKNLEALLDAAALLAADLPALELVVAGDGEAAYIATLRQRAAALAITNRVTWAGHLEGDAKARAFADAAVFALPSHSENFGIAAAEALAAGLPCVLGEGVALAREVAGRAAGLSVAPVPEALAAALRRIIEDPAMRSAMSANALALAAGQYSVQAMGSRLKQLYGEILNR